MSELVAYCDSLKCSGIKIKAVAKLNVNISQTNCPDCGAALFRKKPNTYLMKHERYTKVKEKIEYNFSVLNRGLK